MSSHFSLILFDIDGTLLKTSGLSAGCFEQTVREFCACEISVENFPMSGKTDPQIMRQLLQKSGVDAAGIHGILSQALSRYTILYLSALAIRTLEPCIGIPKVIDGLAGRRGVTLGIITGNLQALVIPKLQSAGLPVSVFQIGAFGSDDEDRNRLPAVALHRAEQAAGRPFLPEETLIVGDTPRDIECARASGCKVLAVATGIYTVNELGQNAPDYLLENFANPTALEEILLDGKQHR